MKNKSWFWLTIIIVLLLAACTSQSTSQTNEIEPTLSGEDHMEASPALATVPAPTNDEMEESSGLDSDSAVVTENETSAESENSKGEVENIGDAAIVFHRSGGIAGLDEQWLVYADGRIEGPDDKQQVDPEQVQALLDMITANNFFALDDSYIPLDTCCDRFTYAITVQLGDNVKTVRTIDQVPEQPQQLTRILTAVNTLLFPSK